MNVALFGTQEFEKSPLETANDGKHKLTFIDTRLTPIVAKLAMGCDAVSCSGNGQVDAQTLTELKNLGVKIIATRSVGFNHIDLKKAAEISIPIVRVPEYSPFAIAEYAVGLLLTLNRKIHRAYNRVHELNFSLDGLVGFDLHGKTVGVIGTGRIGKNFAHIMHGFGCRVLANDQFPDLAWALKNEIEYVDRVSLLKLSDVISLHVPLSADNRHMIDKEALDLLKKTAILINTGRGALIDTHALISTLKNHAIAGACLDVYEEEAGVFFSDWSEFGINDDMLARLITFPDVLITSHQAFLTHEALKNIADTTIQSLTLFEVGGDLSHVLVTTLR